MTMDGRPRVLRPRTQMPNRPVDQPIGWSGVDAMAKRVMNPVRTFETPLVFFPGDINIGASQAVDIQLPLRCAQIAFVNLIPGVLANFNGGGNRTIKDGYVYNGEFETLSVTTDAAGSVTVQIGCY